MTPKIAIRGLTKSFGEKRVLSGLDLDVAPGESVAVIGQSGTGKSVMLKCILGLLAPDGGSIRVDGEEVVGLGPRDLQRVRATFGMLFQGSALFDSLPVWRNVTFGLTQGRLREAAAMRARAAQLLEKVGLGAQVLDLKPAELSGGMQKRVALARAIAPGPDILFFDEPTTGLDPIRAHVIDNLITSLVQDLGTTALTITHDLASARRIAHRVAMLHDGQIVWQGPREALDCSGHPVVEQFVEGRAEGPIR
ncbi:MAG TPA: ATP-binding cassette domain-containing protein [Allosphingosinicella sp.]|jgi:phospholipid/cholesterol/gamma-HCH transport system ATP-binding protein|uniref:ABC transporter ATP-binding protein n=1 Tax=Allosphingosinicella sp. TaxID=2823234 RepID=UPI002F28D93B